MSSTTPRGLYRSLAADLLDGMGRTEADIALLGDAIRRAVERTGLPIPATDLDTLAASDGDLYDLLVHLGLE